MPVDARRLRVLRIPGPDFGSGVQARQGGPQVLGHTRPVWVTQPVL